MTDGDDVGHALADRQAVRSVIVDAAVGLDRRDEASVRVAFWPDAGIRVGGGTRWSVDELVDAWWATAGTLAGSQHQLFNDTTVLDGDEAWSETYYLTVLAPARQAERLPFCGEVAPGALGVQGGRLVDRLERRAGEWRIADRHVLGDWFATMPGSAVRDREPMVARIDRGEPELLARAAITDTVHRASRAMDRLDRELLAAVLEPGAEVPGFVNEVLAAGASHPTDSRYLTNVRIALDGARAVVDAYYLEARRELDADEVILSGGEWRIELTAVGGEDWRITAAEQTPRWQGGGDGTHLEQFLTATGNKSRRDRSDGSYASLVADGTSRSIQDLIDREAVRACLASYARSVDRLDRALLEETFDDVAPQFVDYMFRQVDIRPVQHHNWTNLRIELAGDTAHIEAYYISVHAYVDGASTGFIDGTTSAGDVHFVGGRYVRWFDRVDGRWALRNLSNSPVYPPPSGGLGDWHAVVNGSERDAFLAATGNHHRRGDPDDPSYVGGLRRRSAPRAPTGPTD